MRYAFFTEEELAAYPVALLVPSIRAQEISDTYFKTDNLRSAETLVLDLHTKGKKTPVKEIKQYIEEELAPTLEDMKVQYVLCASGEYFKVLAGVPKIEPSMGYVLDSAYGSFKVVYAPNYRARFYDPEKFDTQLDQALIALGSHRGGEYQEPGKDIIKFAAYPSTDAEIQDWLDKLLAMDCPLTIDTENFSLKHHDSGLGTITFCWNKHEGIAFTVDYEPFDPNNPYACSPDGHFGRQVRNNKRRAMLRDFFRKLAQKAIYHNIAYDVYILVYQLFMDDLLDTEGLLEGLEVMLRDWDCTKLITYLATNSCAGNVLGLKPQSQEFTGNYAQEDIKDIRKIPLPDLLEYNLIDGLATWYVREKHHQTMIDDEQEQIYIEIFQPATVDIIQMQLTGLPLNMDRVLEVKAILESIQQDALQRMQSAPIIQRFEYEKLEDYTNLMNATWKKKRMTVEEMAEQAKVHEPTKKEVTFNPNSGPHLQDLLFRLMGLPIIGYTESKQPSTDKDTIADLHNHTKDPEILGFLGALQDYKAVDKILTAFIPAFEAAPRAKDGWHYLYGNFNLGGTLSGRLSSSKPNLQNLPANVSMKVSDELMAQFGHLIEKYTKKGKLSIGKLIKSCFQAPPGWIFAGLDFDSLEDRISALTTKDPQKLKVYTDGYDGHCLRAYAYFGDNMPDIDPESVVSINSIAKKYPGERQESKVPTFALTYAGTFNTLMNKCGFSIEKAKTIEKRYHDLYKVSDAWVEARLNEASRTGYVTAAFGLRVRTPLLAQVIRGNSKTPYEAEAEGRSAGNALGQSWCLLNSRAGSEFMGKVRRSNFRTDIRPCAQIHDAGYFLIRDDIAAVQYTNEHLVKAVSWQDHPAIWHDKVKLSGSLSLFFPSWAEEIELPHAANDEIIMEAISAAVG